MNTLFFSRWQHRKLRDDILMYRLFIFWEIRANVYAERRNLCFNGIHGCHSRSHLYSHSPDISTACSEFNLL